MEILFLLTLLQIKHYWADFVIQTYAQTVRKGIYRDLCGISHSLDHVWCSWIVLAIYSLWFSLPLWFLFLAPVIEGLLHYHIDWLKVRYGTKDLTKSLFWNQFGMDQLAHQITYLAMALIIA
jgi:hypothetical protein